MYRQIFLVLALLCLHLYGYAQNTVIDSIVKAEMHRQHIVGLSLGIVRNGQVLMQKGYGMENLIEAPPASENTVYLLGSLSKQFIAAAVMQLAEQKKLNLSDHIRKYIVTAPESWDDITIRMLLNHTSGLERESPINTMTTLEKRYPDSFVIQGAYYDTLLWVPGAKWAYSNLGYFILAEVIRKVSGRSFADYMNDLFSSAGLTHTTTTDRTGPEHRATGYTYNEKTGGHNAVPDMHALRPSSAFTSTVADLVKWDAIQRQGKLLTSSDWARMYEDTVLAMAGDDEETAYYGYGWEVFWQNKHRLVRHGGNPYGGGFTSDYWKLVDDKISIILLANATTVDLDKICYKISVALDPHLKKTVTVVPDAKKYIGVYNNSALKMKITVFNDEDGQLSAQATGQPSYPLKPAGNDAFTYTAAGIEMDFFPAENKFILKQHGGTYTFRKE